MVGKINHTILVIPTGGLFLARRRCRISIAKKCRPQHLMKWGKGKNAALLRTSTTPSRLQSAVSVAGELELWAWSPAIGTIISISPPLRGICGQPVGAVVPSLRIVEGTVWKG